MTLVSYLMLVSRLGFYISAIGLNPRGAKAAGIPVTLTIAVAVLLAGGLCGLAGFTIVAVKWSLPLLPMEIGQPLPVSLDVATTIGWCEKASSYVTL